MLQGKSRILHGGFNVQKGLVCLGRQILGNLHGGVVETRSARDENPVAIDDGARIGHLRFKFRVRGNQLSGHAVFSITICTLFEKVAPHQFANPLVFRLVTPRNALLKEAIVRA